MRTVAITVLVLALLGGTAAAFAITERLKLERAPITAPRIDKRFSPTCDCATDTARLGLRFREAESVDALVVDRDGDVVRTLGSDREVSRGDVGFSWDGRDDAGAIVPDGRYQLRLHLERSRRTFLLPNPVFVDTKPPRAIILDVSPLVVSPDGDGRNDRVRISYRARAKVRPIVLVDGQAVIRGKARAPGRVRLQWSGRIDGAAAAPGEHLLELQVVDAAGNVSQPIRIGTIRVRYLELAEDTYRVERGGLLRFRVVTDALPVGWAVTTASGTVLRSGNADSNAVAVRIPKDARPGRYRLVVRVNSHEDEALVVVTRPR